MLHYQSSRHRYLMDESEQALSDAAESDRERDSRIAKQILNDSRFHRLWESRHADLVKPVADSSRRKEQLFQLRDIEVKLLHRRALIKHIRKHAITGYEREQLLSVFYGPRDTYDAILTEHRQYTLAVSSRVSTDHLINVMHDPVSVYLLDEYESVYSKYFGLYCFIVTSQRKTEVEAVKLEMTTLRRLAMRLLKRLHSEAPDDSHSSFEREALLARSGRYPIRDYMLR